jgi:hypothetical protein
MKLRRIQTVFSNGKDSCSHSWVYDKPVAMTFAIPATIIQERICEHCKRFERVELEGRQSKYDMDKFTELKGE